MDEIVRPSLFEIRKRLGLVDLEKRHFLECPSVPGGVPRGVICEVVGTAKTEWLISLLISNPQLNVFWAESKWTLLPTAMQQRGLDLRRILLAETGGKTLQAVRKALRSKIFDCVILSGEIKETRMLKALQLFARESHAAVFFVSHVAKQAWAIPFQIQVDWVQGSSVFQVHILKTKFTHTGEA